MPLPMNLAAFDRDLRGEVAVAMKKCGLEESFLLEPPPRPDLGDFCLACFPFARSQRKSPVEIASTLASEIKTGGVLERVAAQGPYVNLSVRAEAFASAVLGEILSSSGRCDSGDLEHVLLEFSSPNTNKPQHLGHIRNNLLGDATARILSRRGHKVTRINLINDRGIHICKSMLAYRKFGGGETPQSSGKKGDHLVGDYYVRFEEAFRSEYRAWLKSEAARERFARWRQGAPGNKAEQRRQKQLRKAERQKPEQKRRDLLARVPSLWDIFAREEKDRYFNRDSTIGREAKAMLVAWEEGDSGVRSLWSMMNSWVFEGFEQTYRRLGISFDHVDKESETYLLGKSLVEEGLERGIFEKIDGGAVVCALDQVGLQGQKVLLRSDGTSVYMTQDLGTAISRVERLGGQKMVYVVADEQNYHFDVLFAILGLLRPALKGALHHLAYGMVNLPSGKMKSREGTVVDADDLLDRLAELALAETSRRWPELPLAEKEARAETIALAAIKYYVLSFSPRTTVLFDPERSVDFNGDTGPYNLYTYARTRSLFAKSGETEEAGHFDAEVLSRLGTAEERALLHALRAFCVSLDKAADALDPAVICSATYAVSKAFSAFYYDREKHAVVDCADSELKRARLQLVAAVGQAVRMGMGLLGIEVLERM